MDASTSREVVIEDHRIAMADGVHPAARAWRPVDSATVAVPAVLEYIPCRLRDGRALRDHQTHHFLASHGYPTLRAEVGNRRSFSRADWNVTTTHTALTATPTGFLVRATVDAHDGDTRIFSGEWDETIPRDNM